MANEKQFYFLAGLFRSGNTLLSALLDQHPEIYVGPISPLCEYSWVLNKSMSTFQSSITNPHRYRSKNIMSNIFNNYYADVDKPIIFDRDKSWSVPANLELIREYIDPNPKIVYTVRPILETVASLVNMLRSQYINEMYVNNWSWKSYLSEIDNIVDYIMRPGGELDDLTLSFPLFSDPAYKHMFHVVEYKDLVDSPQSVMNGIYDFIGVERFNNNFENIVLKEKQNDQELRLPDTLHEIRPKLSASTTDPKNVFSDYVLNKYQNIDFWKI